MSEDPTENDPSGPFWPPQRDLPPGPPDVGSAPAPTTPPVSGFPPPPPVAPPTWVGPPPGGPGAGLPPPIQTVAPPMWRSTRGLATALTVLFWIAAADAVFGVIAYANRVNFINDVLDGNFGFDVVQKADDADNLAGAAVGVMLLLSLAIFVLIVIWMWRAAKNNEALGRANPRLGPGWAIGGWFIPLANIVIPVLILQDLWRGSDSSVARGDPNWRTRSGSSLIGWYWAAHVVSYIRFGVGRGNARINVRTQMEDLRTHDTIGAVGMAITVAAAILAIRVVSRLTARQEECLRAQQAAWNAANPYS